MNDNAVSYLCIPVKEVKYRHKGSHTHICVSQGHFAKNMFCWWMLFFKNHVIIVSRRYDVPRAQHNTIILIYLSPEDATACLSDPCMHGGTCIGEQGEYTCQCPIQYRGTNCEIGKELRRYQSPLEKSSESVGSMSIHLFFVTWVTIRRHQRTTYFWMYDMRWSMALALWLSEVIRQRQERS